MWKQWAAVTHLCTEWEHMYTEQLFLFTFLHTTTQESFNIRYDKSTWRTSLNLHLPLARFSKGKTWRASDELYILTPLLLHRHIHTHTLKYGILLCSLVATHTSENDSRACHSQTTTCDSAVYPLYPVQDFIKEMSMLDWPHRIISRSCQYR